MNKLTTEQLLFAHRIGAKYCRFEKDNFPCYYKNIGSNDKYLFWSRTSTEWEDNVGWPCGWNEGEVYSIDFSPLYDWIEHDGGECPVKDDDAVVVEFDNIHDGAPMFFSSADSVNWADVDRFKLYPADDQIWPEQRADAIGQNGNDGEHYDIPQPDYDPCDVAFKSEAPETEHSTNHHKRPDGTDLIDDWWDTYPPEVARALMWEQVRKYHNRLGKKDPVHIEVAKMADYMARWSEKERGLAGK